MGKGARSGNVCIVYFIERLFGNVIFVRFIFFYFNVRRTWFFFLTGRIESRNRDVVFAPQTSKADVRCVAPHRQSAEKQVWKIKVTFVFVFHCFQPVLFAILQPFMRALPPLVLILIPSSPSYFAYPTLHDLDFIPSFVCLVVFFFSSNVLKEMRSFAFAPFSHRFFFFGFCF